MSPRTMGNANIKTITRRAVCWNGRNYCHYFTICVTNVRSFLIIYSKGMEKTNPGKVQTFLRIILMCLYIEKTVAYSLDYKKKL